MAKKYNEIIDELEKAVSNLESGGISIDPLNKAIEELKTHSGNISAIEENIDAVKSEVITPIKIELEQNKKAGRFSIWGFYVGAVGIIISFGSLLYTSFGPSDLDRSTESTVLNEEKSMKRIEESLKELYFAINGLNEDYKAKSNEIHIKGFDGEAVLLQNDSDVITVKSYIPPEKEINGRYFPFVSLTLFVNGKKLGTKGMKEIVNLENNSGKSFYYDTWSSVWITENDGFQILNKHRFKIVRIFRKESQVLTVADKENGVIIRKIN